MELSGPRKAGSLCRGGLAQAGKAGLRQGRPGSGRGGQAQAGEARLRQERPGSGMRGQAQAGEAGLRLGCEFACLLEQ